MIFRQIWMLCKSLCILYKNSFFFCFSTTELSANVKLIHFKIINWYSSWIIDIILKKLLGQQSICQCRTWQHSTTWSRGTARRRPSRCWTCRCRLMMLNDTRRGSYNYDKVVLIIIYFYLSSYSITVHDCIPSFPNVIFPIWRTRKFGIIRHQIQVLF